jgi:PKD repeat protein
MRLWILVLLIFPILFAGCNNDENNPIVPDLSPTIAGISPSSVARGQTLDLKISGTNLNGATAVFVGNGLLINKFTVDNATTITVNVFVQRLTSTGKRDVSITTSKGTARATGILTVSGNAPVANFKVDPETDIPQQTDVQFDASLSRDSDGSIKSYIWDFGDGKKANGVSVTHKFNKGTYDVKLTVTDNDDNTDAKVRPLDIVDRVEIKCTVPSANNGFLGATVIGVEGKYAIVQMDKGRTCANTFYLCGDMRLDEPEIFRGIIKEMYFLGDGKFKILNDCPYRWPPQIGEYDVLHYKKCSNNFCP